MCESDSHSGLAGQLLTEALCWIRELVLPSQRSRQDSKATANQEDRFRGMQQMDMLWAPNPPDPVPDAGWSCRIVVAGQQKPWNLHLSHGGERLAD